MSKNLTSIIKNTLKTVSGVEAYQLYRERAKIQKESGHKGTNIFVCLGLQYFAKSIEFATAGAYIYSGITGDSSVREFLNHNVILTINAVNIDILMTVASRAWKRNYEFNKTINDYFRQEQKRIYDYLLNEANKPTTSDYQILGVKQDAPLSEVKTAYRNIAKNTHPDKFQGNHSKAEEFHKATEAYNRIEKNYSKKS